MSDLMTFLSEGRHIFSLCPECGSVHRLTDLQLSRKGKYIPDWLDKLELEQSRLEERREGLESKASELQAAAKLKAERKVLPQLLRRAVPALYHWKIDPRDVRTLIHPVEFVAFRGLNSQDGVREVTFLNLGTPSQVTKSIQASINKGSVNWATLRVGDEGTLTKE